MGMFKSRPDKGCDGNGRSRVLNDIWLSSTLPALYAYLIEDRYEDGAVRLTSTVTLFAEDGLVKLCLNDREMGRTAWASGATLEEAAYSLDAHLADGTVEWRVARPGGAKGSSRR